jgi:RNA polymerase sigma factor (sigma-70 family)
MRPAAAMTDLNDSSWGELFDRLPEGGDSVREEILRRSQEQVRRMARRMLQRFPGVQTVAETDDVLNNVLLRLTAALRDIPIASRADYFRLAAVQVRRELIDLARHYRHLIRHSVPLNPGSEGQPSGPNGSEATVDDPSHLARWEEWHRAIEGLPGEERAVFDLLWYHGLSQPEAAEALGVPLRTVKRRWQSARFRLYEALDGELPL